MGTIYDFFGKPHMALRKLPLNKANLIDCY